MFDGQLMATVVPRESAILPSVALTNQNMNHTSIAIPSCRLEITWRTPHQVFSNTKNETKWLNKSTGTQSNMGQFR